VFFTHEGEREQQYSSYLQIAAYNRPLNCIKEEVVTEDATKTAYQKHRNQEQAASRYDENEGEKSQYQSPPAPDQTICTSFASFRFKSCTDMMSVQLAEETEEETEISQYFERLLDQQITYQENQVRRFLNFSSTAMTHWTDRERRLIAPGGREMSISCSQRRPPG